jgi:hypothetical protein
MVRVLQDHRPEHVVVANERKHELPYALRVIGADFDEGAGRPFRIVRPGRRSDPGRVPDMLGTTSSDDAHAAVHDLDVATVACVEVFDVALDVRLMGAQGIGTVWRRTRCVSTLEHAAGLLQRLPFDTPDAIPDGEPADGSDHA